MAREHNLDKMEEIYQYSCPEEKKNEAYEINDELKINDFPLT